MIHVKIEYFELFNIQLIYCIADDPQEIMDYFESVQLTDIEDAHGLASHFGWKGRRSFLIAIALNLVKQPKIGTISHEAAHLSQYICSSIGYKYQDSEDEIYAHLCEYLTNRYILFLRKIDKFDLFI